MFKYNKNKKFNKVLYKYYGTCLAHNLTYIKTLSQRNKINVHINFAKECF